MGKLGFIFLAIFVIIFGTMMNYGIASDSESGSATRGYIGGGGGSAGGFGGGGGHK